MTCIITDIWGQRDHFAQVQLLLGIRNPRASQIAQWLRIYRPMQKTWVRSLGQKDALVKELTTDCSIPAWEIPWTEEPGGLQSREPQESDMTEQLKTTNKNKKCNQDYTLNCQSPCSQLLHCTASYKDLKTMVSQTQRKTAISKRKTPSQEQSLTQHQDPDVLTTFSMKSSQDSLGKWLI